MTQPLLFKVNHGFEVKKFMLQVNVDFVYATNLQEDKFLLLNLETFGEFTKEDIEKQSKTMKLVTLNNDTLEMKAYNLEEQEIIDAFMKMG